VTTIYYINNFCRHLFYRLLSIDKKVVVILLLYFLLSFRIRG